MIVRIITPSPEDLLITFHEPKQRSVGAASSLRPWAQSIYTGGLGRIQSAPSFRRIYFMRATRFFDGTRTEPLRALFLFSNHRRCNELNTAMNRTTCLRPRPAIRPLDECRTGSTDKSATGHSSSFDWLMAIVQLPQNWRLVVGRGWGT